MIARDCIEGQDHCRPVGACTSHTRPPAVRPSAHAEGRPIFHKSAAAQNSAKTSSSPPRHFADYGGRRSDHEHGGAHSVDRVDEKNADDGGGHSVDDDAHCADDAKFAPRHRLRMRKRPPTTTKNLNIRTS